MPAGRPWCGAFPNATPTRAQLPAPCAVCHLNAERAPALVQEAAAFMDTGTAPDVSTSVPHDFSRPPLLMDALLGPCAPTRHRRRPWFQAPPPAVAWEARVMREWGWTRAYTGELVVLDLNAAWVSGMSSIRVALGELENTGDREYAKRPGYYLVRWHPWPESGMPHPLGHLRPEGDGVWTMARAVDCLRELVAQGRWPECEILDSWTGEPVGLAEWAHHINGLRAGAIRGYGPHSPEYDRVKNTYAQTVTMWLGFMPDDRPNPERAWLDQRCTRADWTHGIHAQTAYTLWQLADDFRRMAPEHPPVELRRVDELLIPAPAWPLLQGQPRPPLAAGSGAPRKPVQVDPDGLMLGSLKVKGHEFRETA